MKHRLFIAAVLLVLPKGYVHAEGSHKHDRGMVHSFPDAKRWAKVFDKPGRDKWQKPEKVIAALELKSDSKVVDLGSGTGYFAVRIAKHVPQGTVIGLDIEASMVDYLNRRAIREKLPNLRSLLAKKSDAALPYKVDVIFVCDTYHHIKKRTAYFKKLKSKLKPSGRIAIVDYKMGKIPFGPSEKHRTPPAQLEKELGAAGYRRQSLDTRTLPYQYIAVYSVSE